ncbi:MAG: hypothetical protein ACLR0U_02995 [Enterocloster clostridioformis]
MDGEVEYDVRPVPDRYQGALKGQGCSLAAQPQCQGSHYVTLVVQVPERMNQAQKEALRRFDDAMNARHVPGGRRSLRERIFK